MPAFHKKYTKDSDTVDIMNRDMNGLKRRHKNEKSILNRDLVASRQGHMWVLNVDTWEIWYIELKKIRNMSTRW